MSAWIKSPFSQLILGILFILAGLTLVVPQTSFGDTINGAGATFPFPLYTKWFAEYQKITPKVRINYQSIGSGGGIKQYIDRTVDFGATDSSMTPEQMQKASQGVIHVPMAMGAVVLTYNLPSVKQPLRFSPTAIASIFRGTITKWNDKVLMADNPGVKLPDQPITPIYRADGSGTTAIFTDFLAKSNADWSASVGSGPSVKWPVGLGGKGNEGVTGMVKQTPGAIGYVELIYAANNKLPIGHIKNSSGRFVEPSVTSVTAAAASLKTIPDDFRMSITNPAGQNSYPIAGITWILIAPRQPKGKGTDLVGFLKWALRDGQAMAAGLSYAPLPKELAAKALKRLDAVPFE